MGTFRQTDAVFTVVQDNTRRAIEVTAANDAAGKAVGYSLDELKGKSLQDIVSPKVAEAIEDYVEFHVGANDVGDVLRKVRDFQLKNRDGKSLPFKLRILRHNSTEHDEFLLVLHNEQEQQQKDAFVTALRTHFDGQTGLDSYTSLPNADSFRKGLELSLEKLSGLEKGISLAVIQCDAYETILAKQGVHACHQWLKGAATLISQNLRGTDVLAHIGDKQLALLLVGASKEPAQLVLNRLRWLLAGHSVPTAVGKNAVSSVTILFHELSASDKTDALLQRVEKAFADKPAESTNVVAYI